MKKVINLETTLKCVYGVLDEDGNVVNKQPVTFEIPKHEQDYFTNALEALKKTKVDLQNQLDQEQNTKQEN